MGFLKKFIKNTFRDGQSIHGRSSFENLTEEQLEQHLKVANYDGYLLTDAVRPSFDLEVVPRAGYRHDKYTDDRTGVDIPVIMASASREDVFDLFMDLIDEIGTEVDVVLETSHEKTSGRHQDLYREHIDLPILKSTLYDFEEMLLNDGCTGIAVLNPRIPVEVQFDEHKLLIIYGHDVRQFEAVLANHGLECDEQMKFITEAEHVHSSSQEFARQFDELRYRLGIDEMC
jgi:hypothetical protein